jgi:4-amino-4-deoxy-L-arabinose transferase-like glycosyltransferase
VIALAGGAIVALLVPARMVTAVRAAAANQTLFLSAVCLIALGLRLLYVQRIMSDVNYLDAGADGRTYDTLAWQMAGGGGVPETFTNRYPLLLLGYVWFLAAIYKVIGHSYLAAVAVQSMIGAAVSWLIYLAGKPVFGDGVARLAALFTALSFSLIFAAASLGHQAVDVFLTALVTVLLLQLVAHDGPLWRWGAAGVMMGAAFAVRETAIFFAAFVAAWIVAAYPRGWRASLPALASYAAGAAIVVLPFLAPKVWTHESRQAMRGHFERMYRGEGETSSMPRPDLVSPVADPGAALSQLEKDPRGIIGTLVRASAQNFVLQFFTQPYGGFDLVFLRKGTEYYYAMWFYAYALTVLGTIVATGMISHRGFPASAVILILGVIASRTFPHLILVSNYRHRVPIEPFLILLASVGAVSLWQRAGFSSRSRGAAAK